MSPRLDVRPSAFLDVASTVIGDGVAAMYGPALRLVAVLDGGAGMAGSDPPAREWAHAYDEAARTVLTATRLLCDAGYRFGALCERAGLNYAHAESAATAGGGAAVPVAAHDPGWRAALGPPPPAGGAGSTDAPVGWGLVEDAVGYVWPNGHQDRLRAAAEAWSASAAGLDDAAGHLFAAGCELATIEAPEVDAAFSAVDELRSRCLDLARAHRRLGHACRDLAGQLDHAHAEACGELASLVAFTAGAEAAGALLSLVTFGAAEVPTQAAVAARIGVAANALRTVFAGAAAAVRTIAAGLPGAAEAAEAATLAAHRILRLRPVVAGVDTARALPVLTKAERGAAGATTARTAGRAATRAKVLSKAESPVWRNLKPYRGKTRTNGKQGKDAEFYTWDHTHGDLEVWDRGGAHLGSKDAITGKMIKPSVPGRMNPDVK